LIVTADELLTTQSWAMFARTDGPQTVEGSMAAFNPELVRLMRMVLEEVMTRVPLDHATPGIKAHLAEIILKAAAQGETSYDGLIAAASSQIQAIVSLVS
jgi:hypothetical protein